MISDLETATKLAKRINKKLDRYGISTIEVSNQFVIMLSIAMDEIRREETAHQPAPPSEE
jgi:hypothetical protein